jgi:hypothetical protein
MTPVPFISTYADRIIGAVMLTLFVWATLRIMTFHAAEIVADFRKWWTKRKATRQTTKGLATKPKFWRW